MSAPHQPLPAGTRVSWPHKAGRGQWTHKAGEVESSLLSGVRHPGYIYTVRADDGQPYFLAAGLLTIEEVY